MALITEQDVNSLSLREVARRVGVSHAAPYRHFPDKDGLLAAVAEEGFIGLTEAMKAKIAEAPDDALKRLAATGVGYVQFAIAHPSHYRVMFGRYSSEDYFQSKRTDIGGQAFQVLLDSIVAGQLARVVRSDDPIQLAWVAWSMVHGLSMLLIDRQLPLAQTEEIEPLLKFVTHTLSTGLGRTHEN